MNRRTFLSSAVSVALAPDVIGQSFPTCGESAGRSSVMLRGVNIAGAEFGNTFPGLHGKDFVYPSSAVIKQQADLGFNLIRLPFRWERLQPTLNGALDGPEWARLSASVTAATSEHLSVILDVHNYAGRRLAQDGFVHQHLIDSSEVPIEAFEQFWSALASRARRWPSIILGLMNEPAGLEQNQWLTIANRAIRAIRETGSTNLILVPGVAYTGAATWYAARNTLMERVQDPQNRIAFEVHQYLDTNASGSHSEAVSSTIGSERVEAFQEWARARGLKAFLGEFASGSDSTSLRALNDLLSEIEQNDDVWLGWSAWAAGPWWPSDYAFRVGLGADGRLTPATKALAGFATGRNGFNDGNAQGRVVDLDLARNCMLGVEDLSDALTTRRDDIASAIGRNGLLRVFKADEPRRTDLGLLIEAAGRNQIADVGTIVTGLALAQQSLVAAPASNGSVLRLVAPDYTAKWRPVSLANDGWISGPEQRYATFSIFVRLDPLDGGELELRAGDVSAMVDLTSGIAKPAAGECWAGIAPSGEWRRTWLTWRSGSRRGLPVTIRGTSIAPKGILLAEPTYEECSGPTTFTLASRSHEEITCQGPLAAALRGEEFTIAIETRGITEVPVALPLLSIGKHTLLGRRADGGLESAIGGSAVTAPVPLSSWKHRQRSVLSISRSHSTAIIAGRGSTAVMFSGSPPSINGLFRLGGGGADGTSLNGIVVRITVLRTALGLEAARDLAE